MRDKIGMELSFVHSTNRSTRMQGRSVIIALVDVCKQLLFHSRKYTWERIGRQGHLTIFLFIRRFNDLKRYKRALFKRNRHSLSSPNASSKAIHILAEIAA